MAKTDVVKIPMLFKMALVWHGFQVGLVTWQEAWYNSFNKIQFPSAFKIKTTLKL